jgi:hypothetical protein
MKQTAVEWFFNEMENLRVKAEINNTNGNDFIIAKVKLLNQANEMFKDQIMDAIIQGFEDGINHIKDIPMKFENCEQYYKQTFKSE